MKNRKWWAFLVAISSITLLSIFGCEGASAIVTLTIALFAANVVQKNEHFNKEN